MKNPEIREMSAQALRTRLAEEQKELAQLRFQHAVTRLEQPQVLREKRKLIARIQTIIKEKDGVAA